MSNCFNFPRALENFKGININFCSCFGDEKDSSGNGSTDGGDNLSTIGEMTIIYPNGGTKESPATITTNQRYEEENPFAGYHVLCIPEVFYKDSWGNPCFTQNTGTAQEGGTGTRVNQLLPEDKLIVQTGNRAIGTLSMHSGSPFDENDVVFTSLPCRVKVIKLAKIVD